MPETMDVQRMEAGREMDALIHERVMREEEVGCIHADAPLVDPDLSNRRRCTACGEEFGSTTYAMAVSWWPYYSTEMPMAWEVVEELTRCGLQVEILNHNDRTHSFDGLWTVSVDGHEARAETAALAICRAALAYKEATHV